MTVQLNAHDRRGHRTTVIHLVCLDSEITELRRAEAHAFAEMLTGAADLLYAPAPSGCPSWCVQHEVDDEDEHTFYHDGPTTAISVRDPLLLGVPITTQVVALESHGTVAMSIQLRIKDGYAKLNAFQARATAAHMLDCAGLLED